MFDFSFKKKIQFFPQLQIKLIRFFFFLANGMLCMCSECIQLYNCAEIILMSNNEAELLFFENIFRLFDLLTFNPSHEKVF